MDKYMVTRDQLKEMLDKHFDLLPIITQIQKQSKTEDNSCALCSSGLDKYWHNLTPVLVRSLVKAYETVVKRGKNYFSKKDLDLDHNEYGNFQKLRFHALIAKFRTDGTWNKGEWCITSRGFKFLQSQLEVPARVQTFRNKVVGHDTRLVGITDVISSGEYVQTDFTVEFETPDQTELA